jgi:hypothetical protein
MGAQRVDERVQSDTCRDIRRIIEKSYGRVTMMFGVHLALDHQKLLEYSLPFHIWWSANLSSRLRYALVNGDDRCTDHAHHNPQSHAF